MSICDAQAAENHKVYLQRKKFYKDLGYDIDAEREFILSRARPLQGRILEAGTGKGHFALALARAGHSFVTFDICEEEQRIARLNVAHAGFESKVTFRIEDGERLSFSDASFDVVLSVNTLHHLARPYKVVGELVRVLAPGGKIVLSDFTAEGLAMMEKIHAHEGRRHEAGATTMADIERHLKDKDFRTRLSADRFQEVLVAERLQP
jgi:ubiquinone/menaquinone biosynthesis C-methylase UbiE